MKKGKISEEIHIMDHFSVYINDRELNVWHLAILMAVLILRYRQEQSGRIKVSRNSIMEMSHIATIPTYHKYFKELQNLGYIKYKPSYHPRCKSEVELSKKRLSRN